ncbi:sugar ABC transporter permease [Streptomyces fimicarius]|uniref:Sugar ABC transporter permease n=1 Tax=Streptomyces caviscabies TaxID=90079 RepID=A0ABW2M8R6_9ACTN|nr:MULTISPECIES: carbohydrate ABC transporter permease [Streptomyces]MCL6286720.1 carbohydrate ABC transporter permease [Streptomyces sp. 43Y-GA-1]MCX4708359.1 carbohydrate ABC transporter permease [Streptomyces griseus]MDX2668996.1 carbohydrate ABC transporter permease [Streptomyces sp. NRRL_ISP-5395]MDX3337876.1 carbohydrate ABC transporter permease [Streptomyces sp. ME02-6979.5a]MDX3501309.1 carbohydrate ABC transporter permease [Streptomyces sp. ATCC51928]
MTTATDTPARHAVRKVRLRGERSPLASVVLHLTLIVASVIAVFPVLWVLLTSLKPAKYATTTDFFRETTFVNYTNLIRDTEFLNWFANSVIISALSTVIGVFVAATTGYAVSRFRFPGKRGLMWTLLVTQMFPVAVLIVPIYNIMSSLGLLNQPAGLVITYLTISVPFCAWMMKGFFDTIPREIDESGEVDGLTPFGTFFRLILPLAKPGLAVTAFYSFITAWGEVAYASAFLVGDENLTLAGGLQKFVNQYGAQWGPMTAASVLIAIPAALVFLFAQKHLVTGMSAGAVKG